MTEALTSDELNEAIAAHDRVVVEFYALWCGPCMKLKPVMERISDKLTAEVVFVDIDKVGQEVLEEYSIMSVPQVLLFENGQYARHIVARSPLPLIEEIG